jgi:Zn-dependent M16 (insulinase) family peptidase
VVVMAGMTPLPTVPCDGLRRKIVEENLQLDNFSGMIKHATIWGTFRLGDDRVVQELQEQKKLVDKILKQIKAVSS